MGSSSIDWWCRNVVTVVEWERIECYWATSPTAITVGVFDGTHRGHRSLIELCRASEPDLRTYVFTFAENPTAVLAPAYYPGNVSSYRQKLELLERCGIATVVVPLFSESFRSLSGTHFLDRLIEQLGMQRLIVGSNVKCGKDLEMNAQTISHYLTSRNLRVDIASSLIDNKSLISSTRVREAVRSADFDTAQRLLGRPFAIDTRGVRIDQDPSCWYLSGTSQVLPRPGNYRVLLEGDRTARTIYVGNDRVGIPRREARCPSTIEFLPTGG